METSTRYILRNKHTGLYYDNHCELTRHIKSAWRFYDLDQLNIWLKASIYAPEADKYEPVAIKVTYELEECANGIAGDHEKAPRTVPSGRH